MKIVILGMGTLGEFLASTFCNDKHDVTALDSSPEVLASVRKRLDVLTVAGEGAFAENLVRADVAKAHVFIAAGRDDTANIHACQLAKKLGAKHVVCRLSSELYFAPETDIPPSEFGINHVVVPQKECAAQIMEAIDHPLVLERIGFNIPDASITAFKVAEGAPIASAKLGAFPEPGLLDTVRLAAIVRNDDVIAPRGDTVILEGDEIYVAGKRCDIDALIEWATPKSKQGRKRKRVIVAGCSKSGLAMLRELANSDYDVRIIEKDEDALQSIADSINSKTMLISGDVSDGDILDEAGISETDVFVALGDDDESNILCSVLAKRMGAEKVVAVTNKEEYGPIIRQMKMIDCDFSRWLVAGNSILRHVSSINRTHTSAMLHRTEAFVTEFPIKSGAPILGKSVDRCGFPESTTLSLVFRDGEALIPSGDLVLTENDIVIAITTRESESTLLKLFQ